MNQGLFGFPSDQTKVESCVVAYVRVPNSPERLKDVWYRNPYDAPMVLNITAYSNAANAGARLIHSQAPGIPTDLQNCVQPFASALVAGYQLLLTLIVPRGHWYMVQTVGASMIVYEWHETRLGY